MSDRASMAIVGTRSSAFRILAQNGASGRLMSGVVALTLLKKRFFDCVGQQLGIQSMEDWYNVTSRDIVQHGGKGLLYHYNGSFKRAITSVYTDYPWKVAQVLICLSKYAFQQPWKFHVAGGFWEDDVNFKEYWNWLAGILVFTSLNY
jgi:hypothetical protein